MLEKIKFCRFSKNESILLHHQVAFDIRSNGVKKLLIKQPAEMTDSIAKLLMFFRNQENWRKPETKRKVLAKREWR